MGKSIWALALVAVAMGVFGAEPVPNECRNARDVYAAYSLPNADAALIRWCNQPRNQVRYSDYHSCTEMNGKYDFEKEMQQAEAIYRDCLERSAAKGQRRSM